MENSELEKFIEGYLDAITDTCGVSHLTMKAYEVEDIPADALTLIKAECEIFLEKNYRLFDEFIERGIDARWKIAGTIFYRVRNDLNSIGDWIPLYLVRDSLKFWDVTKACREAGKFSIKSTSDGKLTFTLGE